MSERFKWTNRPLLHPDRYQDWTKQITPGPAINAEQIGADDSERKSTADASWVFVAIEISQTPSLLENCQWLEAQTAAPIDQSPQIVMTQQDRELLRAQIKALTGGLASSPINRRFDVSMRQRDVLNDGAYQNYDQFTIVFAAPSVPLSQRSQRPQQRSDTINFMRFTASKIDVPDLKRVAIGIIDDGIAFANSRFRKQSASGADTSRFEHLWIQDLTPEVPSASDTTNAPLVYGTTFNNSDINAMLKASASADHRINEAAVYKTAGLDFQREDKTMLGRSATHGTHVLDLAAGYDAEQANDDRPLLGVQLPNIVTADTSGQTLARFALQGLKQIFAWADGLRANDDALASSDEPIALIVNFSYGYQAGPKDGDSFIEREIERLIAERRASGGITFVVMPSGNSFEDRTNARLTLKKGETSTLDWIIQPDDHTESYVEIWLPPGIYDAKNPPLRVNVAPPKLATNLSGTVNPNASAVAVLTDHGNPVAGIYYDIGEQDTTTQNQSRPHLLLAVNRTNKRHADLPGLTSAPSGRWTITLENTTDQDITLDASVQRDDTLSGYRLGARQSYFDHETAHTRSSKTAAYDALSPDGPITGEGSMSAMVGNGSTLVVGAAQEGAVLPAGDHHRANTVFDHAPQPSPYSASGPLLRRQNPTGSAIVDQGPAFPGTYATGVISGSVSLMDGSSAAAPIVCRALADFIIANQARFSTQPIALHDDIVQQFQLSQKTIAPASARLGRFCVETSAADHFVKKKRRYR